MEINKMKISENVEVLEIIVNEMGKPSVNYPVLLHDDDSAVLIDTGFPGTLPQIKSEIEKEFPFSKLKTIIITHQDIDHIGNLSAIVREVPGVKVLCHEEEKPYVQGDKEPHKMGLFKAKLESVSGETRSAFEQVIAAFKAAMSKVDETLVDNDELPYCGGVKVIYTPGHTIGHISLYLKRSKTLIAGDTMKVENCELIIPKSAGHYDQKMYMQSIKKLVEMDLEIEKIICYHGGIYKGGVEGIKNQEL